MPHLNETVVISRSRYEELLKAQHQLHALHATGVDNWEGYE